MWHARELIKNKYRVSVEKLEERIKWAGNVARTVVERNMYRGYVVLCLAATFYEIIFM
jgi:hypothetical protein